MTQLFFDGYSEYELEALKIPTEARGKCLKQLVEYTRCFHKAGVYKTMLTKVCEDERFRFNRCHQKSVNYYTGVTVGTMRQNNPQLFNELNVSPSYSENFTTPTPLNFHR